MDDGSLRDTKGIHNRITRIRRDLITRFEDVVSAAVIETESAESGEGKVEANRDRAITAVAQSQIQVSTAGLIKAAEDMQTLIRQLQELWLFGQLRTLGEGDGVRAADQDAQAVAPMLEKILAGESS